MYDCTASCTILHSVLLFYLPNIIFAWILLANHMRILFFVLSAVLSVLATVSLRANNTTVRYLDTSDGLSNNLISAIYQDSRGFIWIGTRNGLNVYNGNEFTTYINDKYSRDSLLGNDIRQIAGDGGNNVFIASDRGIVRYDIAKAEFLPVYGDSRGRAVYFNGALYYASDAKVFCYDGETSRAIVSVPGSVVCSLCVQNDSIFVGTETKGLFIYDMKTRVMSNPITSGHIFGIFHDSRGEYWITDYSGGGLYCLARSGIRHFTASESAGSLVNNRTHKCCEDLDGNIWVSTFNGLSRYDRETGLFTSYEKGGKDGGVNDEKSFWDLFCDHQGTIWAGTYYDGVAYFNPSREMYRKHGFTDGEAGGPGTPVVGPMVEDGHHNLWIGTEGRGVICYNYLSGKTMHYDMGRGLSSNFIKTLHYDAGTEALWIGTHLGGLDRLDTGTGRVRVYRHDDGDDKSLPSDIVMDIVPYGNDLILSTFGGIKAFSPETGECRRIIKDSSINAGTQYTEGLLIDRTGNLWIDPVGSGLFVYNLGTGKRNDGFLPLLDMVRDKRVNSIYLDSSDRLWVCTQNFGLIVYDFYTGESEEYDTRLGRLESNNVYAVCELPGGDRRYIVTTDAGFSFLDCGKKDAVNYRAGKEIPLDAINVNSLHVTGNGRIFIGGMDGLVEFCEDDIAPRDNEYGILLTRLYINGDEVNPDDRNKAFSGDISMAETIVLGPQCRTFALQYTVTDYLPYGNDEQEFRLVGLSDKWQPARSRMLSYSRLRPGTYDLQIRSRHRDEGELSAFCSVKIKVLAPFYKTLWAYAVYLLMIGGLIWLIAFQYRRRIKIKAALEYEQAHVKEVEELTQNKLRFFTDVSHEFRTPLSIILGQLEVLMQKENFSAPLQNSLLKIYRNCLGLKELATEILDFRKQEQGYMGIKAHKQDLVAFLRNHYQTFVSVASAKKISYEFMNREDMIELWFDERLMWKVMNNLVSNAFKHTPDKGEIKVRVYREDAEAVIEVEDNGEGIPPEDFPRIFDRFYRSDRKSDNEAGGSGVGLALTKGIVELHHGVIEVRSKQSIRTVFTVRLKLGDDIFTEKEKRTDRDTSEVYTGSVSSESLLLSGDDGKDTDTVPVYDGPKESNPSATMLIVEDNKDLRETIVGLFSPYYRIMTASNGMEALDIVVAEAPDIVLTDFLMPGMSGAELCRQLKGNPEISHIPVVMLTAKNDEASIAEGYKAGADDYVGKPFNPQLLFLRCNNLINSRRSMQNKFSSLPSAAVPASDAVYNLRDKAFLDKVTQLVHDRMEQPGFDVDELVHEVGMSRTKFFNRIKDVTGQTPSEFIKNIRLEEAARLLQEDPFLNVTEISDKVGFNSPQYFRKCFKEKYNLTPFEYKEKGR